MAKMPSRQFVTMSDTPGVPKGSYFRMMLAFLLTVPAGYLGWRVAEAVKLCSL